MKKGIKDRDKNNHISVSIIVPVFNEEGSIRTLHQEIVKMCNAPSCFLMPVDWEIIFIDDGSTDRTPELCKQLTPLNYIRLEKKQGQTAAMDRGFKEATGDYIAALDGDGQNDPADIPRLLKYLMDNDLDAVSGWRRVRRDPIGKRVSSRCAYMIRQIMVHDGVHDSGCTLKVYKKECFRDLTLVSDQHRFIPAILKARGFRVGEMEVNHRPRTTGESKYDYRRYFRGMRDLIAIRRMTRYTAGVTREKA